MKMTGAEALIKSLEHEGVEYVFGIPGGQLIPTQHYLYASKKIKHILMRHEQVGAHAADGYARATGKVGVCMATSGPGATNLVTGIANAYMDSIPMVAITGQVPSTMIGTDAFQEADITGITLPVVKHSYLLTDPNEIGEVVKEAFFVASTGRPGPVLIDFPRDIQIAEVDFKYSDKINMEGYKPTTKGNIKQVREAAKAIMRAKKPVVYAGGGVIASDATKELTKLARMMELPVTVTLMGKGDFPETDSLSLGMLGMHGTAYANYAITESDLIIAVGARFDDRVTGKLSAFAPHAKVIHIDIDPAEIGKNVKADIPIVGDAKQVLANLIDALKAEMGGKKEIPWQAWHDRILEWKAKHPLTYKTDGKLLPQFVIEKIDELTKNRDTVICTGVGQHQMWAAQFIKTDTPHDFISSGGLGTMGFGLPSAIGAQFGRPKSLVIDIDGDGSFQMVSQDLATCIANKLPVKVCIMNNRFLGMVRQWQELFWDSRYAAVNLEPGMPDFVKLADAYGAKGYRVTKPDQVVPTLKDAFSNNETCVIEFVIEREENVFPMVAPGAELTDMMHDAPRRKK